MVMQVIKGTAKTAQTLTVNFTPGLFSDPPIVIVSPHNSTGVNYQEVVKTVTASQCVVVSKNMSPEYKVNILAITSGPITFGDATIISGKQLKTADEISVNILNPGLTSPDPVVLLTPFWSESATAGLGSVDTVDDSAASEFSIYSANKAPQGYYTQYLVMNIGIYTHAGKKIHNGILNKNSSGELRVYFTEPFTEIPTIFLTPWYNDQNLAVGNLEASVINKITIHYFVLSSGNHSPHYFCNWLAYGS